MKLSTAIRIGSALRPQAFGRLFKNGGSCVIGAAFEGAGLNLEDSLDRISNASFIKSKCPACELWNRVKISTVAVIMHLNDKHRWTREAIADLVETLETSDTQSSGTSEGPVEKAEELVEVEK